MADPISFTINDQVVTAKPGQMVLQAAMEAGIYVPYLCYFPKMKPYGACRMCVVEVERNGRTMTQASCTVPVQDDIIVRTNTEPVRELRKGILDLLMTEHPHGCLTCHRIELCGPQDVCLRHVRVTDRCTICPKNERCELKDTVRSHELDMHSPLEYNFRNLPRHVDDPFYDRDYNLCIVCARCVRVCQEVRVDTALTLTSRSGTALVGTSHGTSLLESGCEFCGACVDVCPVGALVERDYKWEKATETVTTVCSNCPVGCQIRMEVNRFGKAIRHVGDLHGPANNGQLCFKGKFASDYPNHKERLQYPLVRVDGELKRTTWEQALDAAAQGLKGRSGDEVAVITSPRGTNEDQYVSQKFARLALGTNNVDSALNITPELAEGLMDSFGYPAATNSIWELEQSGCVMVIGGNPTEEQNVLAVPIKKASAAGATIIVIDARETEMTRYAKHWLRPIPGTEAALVGGIIRVILDESLEDKDPATNEFKNVDEFKKELWEYDVVRVSQITGVSQDEIRAAARSFGNAHSAAMLYGADLAGGDQRVQLARVVANLALITGNFGRPGGGVYPLFAGANTQGANDAGATPRFLPGYQPADSEATRSRFEQLWGAPLPAKPGQGVVSLFEGMRSGNVKAALLMADGVSPFQPGLGDVDAALSKLDFLVVSDAFLSEITHHADVVLPAAVYSEVGGTYTNLERRVQMVRPGMSSRDEQRCGWETVSALANAMSVSGFDFASSSDVFAELAAASPIYRGLSHQRIGEGSVQWPCPSADHEGTPVLTPDSLADVEDRPQYGSFAVTVPEARSAADGSFVLAQGRILHDPERRIEVVNRGGMNYVDSDEVVELHPSDAERLGITEGDLVDVRAEPLSGQPAALISGYAHLTFPHAGFVGVTTLFGHVVSAMQDSEDPDPAPRVVGLPLRNATVAKAPALERAGAAAH